jgi:hypothetical protein
MRACLLVALAMVAGACGPGPAPSTPTPSTQPAAYRFGGDTLRFREVSEGRIGIAGPQGNLEFHTTHDGTIAIARLGGDTARAWYEALAIGFTGPMSQLRPATDAALRQPFTLRMDDRGRVTTLATPTFPASFKDVSDLTQQFADYFPRLGAQPLVVGTAWSDTTEHVTRDSARTSRIRSVAHYRVERDTVVGGMPAMVVSMQQELTIDSNGAAGGAPTVSTQAGVEVGFYVFAPRTGRLLSRRRSALLEGELAMGSGAARMAMKQAFSYTSSIDALP